MERLGFLMGVRVFPVLAGRQGWGVSKQRIMHNQPGE